MTVQQLIDLLEGCAPDAQVRLAFQPNYPFEHSIDAVEEVYTDDGSVVYISEKAQIGYLPTEARDALGWR